MTPNLQCIESSPKFVGCATQPFPEVPDGDDLLMSEPKRTSSTCTQNWTCVSSQKSMRTINPIRAIVDPIVANGILSGLERGDGKDHISLALGDPTVGSNLPACSVAIDAVIHAIQSPGHAAGYVPACGTWEARCAIAQHHSSSNGTVLPDDVIVANGCSGALELVLTALLDEDSILLVPMPGFPLYQVICESHGASVAHYHLDAANNWEIDLNHLDTLMNNARVKGIVINNPSNPTGSVYSKQHLKAVFRLCERRGLPIIADEIYGDLVFGDNVFTSMAEIMFEMGRTVPVIVTSGLAKQYLVPGWRVGWAVFYDSYFHALQPILEGAKRLAQVILGASHLAQSVIPALLTPSPALSEWKLNLRQTLESRAKIICDELSKCHGLTVYTPQGSMYAIVKIDLTQFSGMLHDDVEITKRLLHEENVFVLPGQAFHYPGVFRVVYCASPHILMEASRRIYQFCLRHRAIEEWQEHVENVQGN